MNGWRWAGTGGQREAGGDMGLGLSEGAALRPEGLGVSSVAKCGHCDIMLDNPSPVIKNQQRLIKTTYPILDGFLKCKAWSPRDKAWRLPSLLWLRVFSLKIPTALLELPLPGPLAFPSLLYVRAPAIGDSDMLASFLIHQFWNLCSLDIGMFCWSLKQKDTWLLLPPPSQGTQTFGLRMPVKYPKTL